MKCWRPERYSDTQESCFTFTVAKNEHITHFHNISNIKPVDVRRKSQILTCIWRDINEGIIKLAEPMRLTRAAIGPTIYPPVPRNELFKKSVSYYGATLWNRLPIHKL